MRTPPGVKSGDFATALEKFANVTGKEWVFTSDEDVALYRDAYSPLIGEPNEKVASAALAPKSVEEVQAIVTIANQYKIPLYPISTGKNITYGGSAPVYSGSVVLDLKRMNKIIEVSEKGAYCLVEPGVSFFDLYRHIRENRLKVRMSQPDPGWGSPIGNSLEHGVGRHVYRDHFKSHCGMEIVLPTGELLRTGMGALPNSGSLWQRFHYAYGPDIDGIFSQSNFGIVTKMGFHMLPEPEATRVFDMSIARFDDLDAFLEEISFLQDSGILNCNSELTCPLLSTAIPDSKALLERGNVSAKEWDALGDRLGIPPWRMAMNLLGPAKIVQSHYEYVVEGLSRFAGFKVQRDVTYPGGADPSQVPNVDKCVMGIPSLQVFTYVAMNPGPGHMDFSPVFPMTGEAVRKINALLQQGFKEAGLNWAGWRGGNDWFGKSFVMINGFQLSPDPAENKKIVAGFGHLLELLAANGFTEYRTHTVFHDLLAKQYAFNNNALLHFHEKLKDAIDPNGIVSAGRCGIWPKVLRKDRA